MNISNHILFFTENNGYIGYNEVKYCEKVLTQSDINEMSKCGYTVKYVHPNYKDLYVSSEHFMKKDLAAMKKMSYIQCVNYLLRNNYAKS